MDKNRIEAQLNKLGSTVLEYNTLSVDVDENLYIPVKEINKVRRIVTDKIEQYILGDSRIYNGRPFSVNLFKNHSKQKQQAMYSASVLTDEQADICYELGFNRIYIPYPLYINNKSKYDADPDIYSVKLNPVNSDAHSIDYSNIATESVCITNIGQIGLVPSGVIKYGDYRLNICNSLALTEYKLLGLESACISSEMTLAYARKLNSEIPLEVLIYGKVALMTLKNCIVKSSVGKCCCQSGGLYYLKDRKDIAFPVECISGECINIIYNSVPIYMADRLSELSSINASCYRFDFTDESAAQVRTIMRSYETGAKSAEFFTRGHFYNGVV